MRYFIDLSYNGTHFHGWQIQPKVRTVQETLNLALTKLLRHPVEVLGAGRTDAGVHAEKMIAHFDSRQQLDITELIGRLNAFLADDLVVHRIYPVEDNAHARFDAKSRTYEYRIFLGRNPFLNDTNWQIYNQDLDINKMNESAAVLLEYTNFKCFSKSKTEVKTYNCKISKAEWKQDHQQLTFYISADRFLRNMVRAIVGTLVDIGLGKTDHKTFVEILKSEDRSKAGVSVPARALFLTEIVYPAHVSNHKK